MASEPHRSIGAEVEQAGDEVAARAAGGASNAGDIDQAITRDEREQMAKLSSPRAVLVHEIIREEGEVELARPAWALAWSALAGGFSIGFSMITDGLIRAALPEAEWRPLLASLGYPLGFLIAVLGRQQLFTESTLTAVLPLLYRRDRATLVSLLRFWGVVLAGNTAGTILFAVVIAQAEVFSPDAKAAFTAHGQHALLGGFGEITLRAVFSGWLLALVVWLLPAAGSAAFLVIFAITYVVGLGNLTHVVAGSTEVAYLVALGDARVGDYLLRFFLPSLVGNVIGGVLLVAILGHAQVAPELQTAGGANAGKRE